MDDKLRQMMPKALKIRLLLIDKYGFRQKRRAFAKWKIYMVKM